MANNPHDALFKGVFAQPEHARGALRAIVPPALAEALDWQTLALCPGSFVDPALAARHTDLLFSAELRGGGQTLLYVLFEHQSTPDALMAYRLLRYQVRIWERWLAERGDGPGLPAILPVVLYHGAQPWPAPLSFMGLIDVPGAIVPTISRFVPNFEYLLDDLSGVADADLRARAMTALGTLAHVCLKHARGKGDLVGHLEGWADALRTVVSAPNGLEALRLVIRYILVVDDRVVPERLEALLDREIGGRAKEVMVTIGEQLIEQGRQQGMHQGMAQGMAQGIAEGERVVLLRLLRRRFGELPPALEQRVHAAVPADLEQWAERVLSADSLEKIFAG